MGETTGFSREPVAADVTTLISASSFVTPIGGRQDPRAEYSFEAAATDFCSGQKLFLPVPRLTPGEGALFLDLWNKHSAKIVPNAELSDDGYEDLSNYLASSFETFIEGDPIGTAQWVAFQFTPGVVSNVMRRSAISSIERAGYTANELLKENRFPKFRSALLAEQVREPSDYTHLIGGNPIKSLEHLCVAYVICLSLRRVSYAMCLSSQDERPIYRYHWIGNPVIKSMHLFSAESDGTQKPVRRFPWGSYLSKIINDERAKNPLTKEEVRDILLALRESASSFEKQYCALSELQSNESSPRLNDREQVIIQALLAAGIAPRYKESLRTERLSSFVRTLGGEKSWTKIVAETVTASIQAKWIREAEAQLRINFRRDNFWDIFERPILLAP